MKLLICSKIIGLITVSLNFVKRVEEIQSPDSNKPNFILYYEVIITNGTNINHHYYFMHSRYHVANQFYENAISIIEGKGELTIGIDYMNLTDTLFDIDNSMIDKKINLLAIKYVGGE